MRKAFTFIELVFVIVVIGILAKFGTNILVTAYTSYAASTHNNRLLSNTEQALQTISNRLQYRLRASVITRTATNAAAFAPLSASTAADTVLEWVGYDIDGWLGNAVSTNPVWSGFIDVDDPTAATALTYLESPASSTIAITNVIQALRANASTSTINNAAIFFTGENSDITTSYGWAGGGVPLATQNGVAAHRIQQNLIGTITQFSDPTGTGYGGVDVYENYKLAWTAYAISLEDFNGDGRTYKANHPLAGQVIRDLVLYYDYQPWDGDAIPLATDVNKRQLLLQQVDTFTFRSVGDSIMLQICTNNDDALGAGDGGYSICEETAIF